MVSMTDKQFLLIGQSSTTILHLRLALLLLNAIQRIRAVAYPLHILFKRAGHCLQCACRLHVPGAVAPT